MYNCILYFRTFHFSYRTAGDGGNVNENVKKDAMSTSKYYIMDGQEYTLLGLEHILPEAKYTFSRGSVYLARDRVYLPRVIVHFFRSRIHFPRTAKTGVFTIVIICWYPRFLYKYNSSMMYLKFFESDIRLDTSKTSLLNIGL